MPDLRDTLKPKVEGWSLNNLLINVDLPLPDGPEITMGLLSSERGSWSERYLQLRLHILYLLAIYLEEGDMID